MRYASEPGTHITPAASCWSVSALSPPGRCASEHRRRRAGWTRTRARSRGSSSAAAPRRTMPRDGDGRCARERAAPRAARPRRASAVATKQTCSRMCTLSLRTAASYSDGTCQTAIAAVISANATAGRDTVRPTTRNERRARERARDRAARAKRERDPETRPRPAEHDAAAAATVSRTTCCVMCSANDVSAQSSNGGSSTTSTRRDAGVERRFSPDAMPPASLRARTGRRGAQTTSGGTLNVRDLHEVEDDPREDDDPGEERPVEAERVQLGAHERHRVADVVARAARIARRLARRDGGRAARPSRGSARTSPAPSRARTSCRGRRGSRTPSSRSRRSRSRRPPGRSAACAHATTWRTSASEAEHERGEPLHAPLRPSLRAVVDRGRAATRSALATTHAMITVPQPTDGSTRFGLHMPCVVQRAEVEVARRRTRGRRTPSRSRAGGRR